MPGLILGFVGPRVKQHVWVPNQFPPHIHIPMTPHSPPAFDTSLGHDGTRYTCLCSSSATDDPPSQTGKSGSGGTGQLPEAVDRWEGQLRNVFLLVLQLYGVVDGIRDGAVCVS